MDQRDKGEGERVFSLEGVLLEVHSQFESRFQNLSPAVDEGLHDSHKPPVADPQTAPALAHGREVLDILDDIQICLPHKLSELGGVWCRV